MYDLKCIIHAPIFSLFAVRSYICRKSKVPRGYHEITMIRPVFRAVFACIILYIAWVALGILPVVRFATGRVNSTKTYTNVPYDTNLHQTTAESANEKYNPATTNGQDWIPNWDLLESRMLPIGLQDSLQSDPDLIAHIREHWLEVPDVGAYNLADPGKRDFSQAGQSTFVDYLFQNMTDGFFVECGAADGEKVSNTLFLERERNWSGILIEANPSHFQSLLEKNRKAYKVLACLSPIPKPMVLNFTYASVLGGLSDYRKEEPGATFYQGMSPAQCLPFYSILAAIGQRHVQYFSLDIEGAEMEILKTIPFDDVTIDVIGVETFIKHKVAQTRERRMEILGFLQSKGYRKLRAPFTIDLMMRKR